jgi:hypothetical protein
MITANQFLKMDERHILVEIIGKRMGSKWAILWADIVVLVVFGGKSRFQLLGITGEPKTLPDCYFI